MVEAIDAQSVKGWKMINRLLFIVCSMSMITCVAAKHNQINKVFYHKGNEQSVHVELAKIALYFTHKPQVRVDNTQAMQGIQKLVFHFEDTYIDNQLLRKLIQNNAIGYNIQAQQNKKGVDITVSYKPSVVAISYDTFQSISMQPGLVIHFFNQAVLDTLNKVERPILQTTSLNVGKKKVVIDVGHGGTDTGTCCFGLKEKDVTLTIGKKLAQLLRKQGISVVMTRITDCTSQLDERTTLANATDAQLLVSIHANYASNEAVEGIETFCIQPYLLQPQQIFFDSANALLIQNIFLTRYNASHQLAQLVHKNVINTVSKQVPIHDRSIKYAVPQVLLGAHMPAILVEVGFLSNKKESMRLKNNMYTQQLAQGLCKGICDYLHG